MHRFGMSRRRADRARRRGAGPHRGAARRQHAVLGDGGGRGRGERRRGDGRDAAWSATSRSPTSAARSTRCCSRARTRARVIQGLGHTLFEEMVYEDGHLLNGTLLDYRVPRADDAAGDARCRFVENADGSRALRREGRGRGQPDPGEPGRRERPRAPHRRAPPRPAAHARARLARAAGAWAPGRRLAPGRVRDAVDAPGLVVRDEQRAIGHHQHVRRAARMRCRPCSHPSANGS